jgi:hypothetical protein
MAIGMKPGNKVTIRDCNTCRFGPGKACLIAECMWRPEAYNGYQKAVKPKRPD